MKYDMNEMTLRDWFAGQALQALAANKYNNNKEPWDKEVEKAYRIADVMLKEREVKR